MRRHSSQPKDDRFCLRAPSTPLEWPSKKTHAPGNIITVAYDDDDDDDDDDDADDDDDDDE